MSAKQVEKVELQVVQTDVGKYFRLERDPRPPVYGKTVQIVWRHELTEEECQLSFADLCACYIDRL